VRRLPPFLFSPNSSPPSSLVGQVDFLLHMENKSRKRFKEIPFPPFFSPGETTSFFPGCRLFAFFPDGAITAFRDRRSRSPFSHPQVFPPPPKRPSPCDRENESFLFLRDHGGELSFSFATFFPPPPRRSDRRVLHSKRQQQRHSLFLLPSPSLSSARSAKIKLQSLFPLLPIEDQGEVVFPNC